MPLSFSMVDESEPLVDSPLSSPATSPHSSSTDLTALVDNATTTPEQLEPEPEPRTEEGPAAVGVSGLSSPFTSPDIRSCVLSCLTCFELVRLRRVSVDMKQHAEAALESSAVQLGERTAAEWLAEHAAPATRDTLWRLLPLCPGVSGIDLAPFGRDAVADDTLEVVARHCRTLHVLQAAGPGDITDTGMRLLCRQRTLVGALRRVVLTENFAVGDAAIEALALGAPRLAELEAEATGMSDMGLVALAKSASSRELRLLNAGYCRGVSDFGVRQLVSCRCLLTLNLTACVGVTGAGIAAVCEGCNLLTSLRVDQCTDVTDVSLQKICSGGRLELLTIGQCTAVTDSTLELLGRCSPELHRLDLWGLGLITDQGLGALAAGCMALQHLDVSRCPSLTDAGLAKIPAQCHQLRHLAFASCHAGTDTLLALGAHCAQLCHLNANYSQQGRVADPGLLAVANGCPALRHLEVCSSPGITDVSLIALAGSCARIEHVDFSACPRVSDFGVKALAKHCPMLTDVYLGGCAVTDESVAALRSNCPSLHYLFISCTQTSAGVANSTQQGWTAGSSGEPLHIHR
jgi:hypothetical protein